MNDGETMKKLVAQSNDLGKNDARNLARAQNNPLHKNVFQG